MKLQGFNIILEQITAETSEIVRQWRNRPEILAQMEFQEIISEDQQQIWYHSIDSLKSIYFIISTENKPIGMIHLAKIDDEESTAETGLFIGDSTFSGTGIALGASLLLLKYAFKTLLLKNVTAKVNNHNISAQKYNQLLGFKKEKALNNNFTQYILSKETYHRKKTKLENLIR